MKKVIAISGSTRASSSNLSLIKAIKKLAEDKFSIDVFTEIGEIPHFNPDLDLDTERAPQKVKEFRKKLNEADGILICTPEYAMGVPGTLKNAIDWTVSSMEFSKKPTGLITASLSGEKGHASLLETLKIIEAKFTEDTELVISYIKTKVNSNGEITDKKTYDLVNNFVIAFDALLKKDDL